MDESELFGFMFNLGLGAIALVIEIAPWVISLART